MHSFQLYFKIIVFQWSLLHFSSALAVKNSFQAEDNSIKVNLKLSDIVKFTF